MEESKDLITAYKIFRTLIYVSLIVEFFMYAIDPQTLDFLGGIICDIHSRMKRWYIYNDGNLLWSKMATLLIIQEQEASGVRRKTAGALPFRQWHLHHGSIYLALLP